MPAIVITPANVLPPASAQLSNGIAGETVAAGEVLYLKPADNRWWKADCLTLEKAGGVDGLSLKWCMGGAVAGQPVPLLNPGQAITVGNVLTKGLPYVLSNTAGGGKIDVVGSLASTNFLVVMGWAVLRRSSILIR